MEDAFKQACKMKTAQKLRNLIPQELLLGLKEVERLASSDAADNILSLWQEELQGVFRLEALQLFQGAVELAMTQKNIVGKSLSGTDELAKTDVSTN